MYCYRDRTYCISPNCKCGKKLTPEIQAAADKWWADVWKDREPPHGTPIAMAYLCDKPEGVEDGV